MKNFKFKAIPSGDYEAFTFAVSKEDYIKITGKEPRDLDKNDFNENKYNLYPDNLFDLMDSNNKEFEIEIIIK